ncbi:hypothetical protein SCHPADRAFT_1003023 [Schizopora paradoxa]|uniref:Uncharacterized protein n=1 Tax=Schizopora paradoxa TaxID=27342 RepID=A0A0H2R0E3_9AGAM|nr:hypothetical protein SCHPADRAFT_1003023 [Schizopora paradoxa]
MGWKLRDDGVQELCRSLDYLLEAVQTLKEAVRMGRMLDGKGGLKVDPKELWCHDLTCSRTSSDTPIVGEDAKTALKRLKNARTHLTSLSKSLDDAIRVVVEASSKTCRPAGLALLPDDILAQIFEIYIDSYDMPDNYDKFVPLECSPQILSSVCRRFRHVAIHIPSLWRNMSLSFPKRMLLQHKERCTNPIVHISPAGDVKLTRAKMLDLIQPPHQWRELRLHYSNEDHASRFFSRLQRLVKSPFYSLERLSICNDVGWDPSWMFPPSARPLRKHAHVVSSWRMPKLSHLELRNFIPHEPIHCENVTSLTLHFTIAEDIIDERKLRDLFRSMPKIQSLSVLFNVGGPFDIRVFDETLPTNNRPVLLDLKDFDLNIQARTPANAIGHFIALVDLRLLTRFSLRFFGDDPPYTERTTFEKLVSAIFPFRIPDFNILPTFANVAEFTLRIESFRGSPHLFERIFTSMPNVREISLALLHDSNITFAEQWTKEGAFQRLRTLRIEVLQMDPRRSSLSLERFGAFAGKENCKKFRKMEVRNPTRCLLAKEKEELESLLGEKLCWIDC